jgi:uncharacterized protein (TIGR03435 family)
VTSPRWICGLALLWSAVAVPTSPARAQAGMPSTTPPAFEVASVRVSSTGARTSRRVTDTRVDLINFPLTGIVRMAFGVEDYQLVRPSWMDSVRVDINAIVPVGAVRAHVPEMLRDLLRRRFGAEWHIEQRPLDVSVLLVGADGISAREVPRIDELDADPPTDAAAITPISETVEGRVFSFATRSGVTTVTSTSYYTQTITAQRTMLFDAKRITMDEFATVLQFTMGAPIVNRTGLSAGYEFEIELPRPPTRATTTRQGTPVVIEPPGVSVPDAVKAIGLQLERRRTPVDVIVVDKFERTPTAN